MARPARIPERGDVAPSLVACRLGVPLEVFRQRLAELVRRGFPEPDPTTGNYAIEAVDRWRLRRHGRLFPELTAAPAAVDADAVFVDRLGRMGG